MTSMLRRTPLLAVPLLFGSALLPSAACTATTDQAEELESVEVLGTTFEEFEAATYREPESGIYIVNGDTPIDDIRELKEFYMQHVQTTALTVHQAGGADATWSASQKMNLTYCVSSGFGANYDKVVSALNAAAGVWEGAASVDFIHSSSQDSSCNAQNQNVVFDVRPTSGQPYLARAFFPDSGRTQRNLLIDSSAFGSLGTWTLGGILRHEMGHTLGFRHEHTRPQAGTCFEDNNWRALTSYDSASVMHYPQCNGSQQGDLVLTQKDKEGAASIYGAPGGQPPPTPPGPSGSCTHDKCSAGGKLVSGCDPCVTQICAADPYCCNTKWDTQCVNEVSSICSQTCP